MTPLRDPAVIGAYPPAARRDLLRVRELILRTAADTPGVGALEETLKWGEPAYLTAQSKSGSTIRIDWKPKHRDQIGLYFNCRTSLVDTFRSMFPDDFVFEGKRALVLRVGAPLAADALTLCIGAALTYHLRKRQLVSA